MIVLMQATLPAFPAKGQREGSAVRRPPGRVNYKLKGQRAGQTKADFFREEQAALGPFQPGLFDGLADGAIRAPSARKAKGKSA